MKWTPSKMIARLGKEINNPESVYYWAQKVRGRVGAKTAGCGRCYLEQPLGKQYYTHPH